MADSADTDSADTLEKLGEVNIDDVLGAILAEMGGVDAFAKEVVKDFRILEAGAPLRQRISQHLLNLIEKRTGTNLDDLTDLAELEAEERRLQDVSSPS